MAGKSSVVASEEQLRALADLSQSRDRGEADRARAILLTLSGWTSISIGEAFGVRQDTARLWRSTFMTGGVEAGIFMAMGDADQCSGAIIAPGVIGAGQHLGAPAAAVH